MKLRLPHKLQAALIATLASVSFTTLSSGTIAVATGAALLAGQQAQAEAYNGVEYSGDIFTIENKTSQQFHLATFSNLYWDGTGWVSSPTWTAGGKDFYSNGTKKTLSDQSFWYREFAVAGGTYGVLGNTIRLTGATADTIYESTFNPFVIGGIIAEASDYTYVLGRSTSGNISPSIQAMEGQEANLTLDSSLILSSNNGVTVASSGTWKVAGGKSLQFGRTTQNTTTISQNTAKVEFSANVHVDMIGGGVVDITRTNAFILNTGATISVGEGTTLRIATTGASVYGKALVGSGGGAAAEAGSTDAFTKIFMGQAVNVQDGGKLVLVGNVCFNDTVTGNVDRTSGVADLEITGSLRSNVGGKSNPWVLGDHKMKVGGDFWLTNQQHFNLAGGTIEVGGALKLGHEGNGTNGNYKASLNATAGSTVKLHDVMFYGGHDVLSVDGSSITFTKADGNVLSQDQTHVPTAAADFNSVSLNNATLVAQENGWTLDSLASSTVTVRGASKLDIAGGNTIQIGHAAVSGSFTALEGSTGTLQLNDATFTGTVGITGANVGVGGTVTLDLANLTTYEVADATGQQYSYNNVSGFLTASGKYYLVHATGEPTSTATWSGSFADGSATYDEASSVNGNIVFSLNTLPPSTSYYVNADMDTRSDVTGGTYNLLTKATDVYIKKGVTLTAFSVSDSFTNAAKLHGEGTYALAKGASALNSGLSLGTDWTGTVVISNAAFTNQGLSNALNNARNSLSWVKAKGLSGWNNTTTINANLILENGDSGTAQGWAYMQDNGNTGQTLTFAGMIKGDGKMGRSNDKGSVFTYEFTNDISGWTGTFESRSQSGGSTTFRVKDNATVVNAILDNKSNNLYVDVQNNATFNAEIKNATKLTIASGKTATLAASATLGSLAGAGALVVDNGSNTVTVNGSNNYTGSITVDGGTLALGNHQFTGVPSLTINDGGTVTTANNNGSGLVGGTVTINAGGTLKAIGGKDIFGYETGATDKVVMQGSAEKEAKIDLSGVTGGSVTMTTDLEMKGYSTISGGAINSLGGSITVSGTNNTISSFDMRDPVTIDVAAGGALEIGSMSRFTGFSGAITKTGAGSLTLKGGVIDKAITMNAGSLALDGTFTVDGLDLVGEPTVYYTGAEDFVHRTNGVRGGQLDLQLLTEGSTGSLSITDTARFTYDSQTMKGSAGEAGTLHLVSEGFSSTFYINEASERTAWIFRADTDYPATDVSIARGATLVVDDNAADGFSASKIHVQDGTGYANLQIEAGNKVIADGTDRALQLSGAGEYKLNGSVRLGSLSTAASTAATPWTGTIDATVVGDGTNLLDLLTNTNIHGGTVQLQSKGNSVTPAGTETALQTNLANQGRTGDFTLADTTFTTGGAMRFNDWQNNHVWTVGSGSGLQVGGDLWMDHGNKLAIAGGNVTVGGKLLLGHSGGNKPTGLEMTGGSFKATQIDAYSSSASPQIPVSITGGTVEFTGTGNVLQIHNSAVCDVNIGGTGDNYVTLKADGTSWSLAYEGMTIGNIIAETDNGGAITLGTAGKAASYTGKVEVAQNSILTLDGILTLGANGIVTSGVLGVSNTTVFNLEHMEARQEGDKFVYNVFTGAGANLSTQGFTAADNIIGISTAGKEWTFGNDGTISYVMLSSELVWKGVDGSGVWNTTEGNQPWLNGETPSAFRNDDAVTFDSTYSTAATATLGGNVEAASITVAAGANVHVAQDAQETYTLTSSSLVVNGTLTSDMPIAGLQFITVGTGATWNTANALDITDNGGLQSFSNAGTIKLLSGASMDVDMTAGKTQPGVVTAAEGGTLHLHNVPGSAGTFDGHSDFNGTLVYDVVSSKGHDASIVLENFDGTLELRGRLAASASNFGGMTKLVLFGDRDNHPSNINDLNTTGLWNQSALTLSVLVEVKGDETVDLYTSNALTLTGDINSAGAKQGHLSKRNGGDLNLQGGVYLLSYDNNAGTVNMSGAADITTLNVVAGTVNMSGGANIATLNAENGTVALGGQDKTYTLGAVALGKSTGGAPNLTIGAGADVTADTVKVEDLSSATIVLADDLDITDSLSTMGAERTLTIKSADGVESAKTLTTAKLDIANVNTGIALQNVILVVNGKASVAEIITGCGNNRGLVSVGAGATLNLNGGVDWSHDGKYVNLAIADGGNVNITAVAGNVLNDLTIERGGDLTVGAGATTSVEGTATISEVIAANADITFNGAVDINGMSDAELTSFINGQDGGNGFKQFGGALTVVDISGGGSVSVNPETVISYNGKAGELRTDGKFYLADTTVDYTTFFVNKEGEKLEKYSLAVGEGGQHPTAVQIAEGASFTMDVAGVTLDNVTTPASTAETPAVSTLAIAEAATVKALTIGNDLALTGEGTLTLGTSGASTASISGTGSLTFNGPTVTLYGNNSAYTGNVVINSGTVIVGNDLALGSMAASSHTITLKGGTLDVHGFEGTGTGYTVEFAGGKLTNTGTERGYGNRQLVAFATITADSEISNADDHEFGFGTAGHAAITVTFSNGAELNKTGDGTFWVSNATVTGNGGFKVSEGTLHFQKGGTYASNFEMAGGTVAGAVTLAANTTIETTKDSTFSAVIDGSGKSVTLTGDNTTLTLSGANTYTGGTTITAGTVKTTNASALGTGNVTVASTGTLLVSQNLTIKGDGTATNKGLDNQGTVSIADGKTLSLYGQVSNKQYNLGTVNVLGSTATIENTNHRGTISLGAITGTAGSTVTLFSNHSSEAATWNLGTAASGSFAGDKLVLQVGDNGTGTGGREVSFNFNNEAMFSGKSVQLQNATVSHSKTMTNNVVLNAATVKVGGISDAAEDTVASNRIWSISKGSAAGNRATLELDGNDANGYSTAVKVGADIDIKKTGSATQVFSGNMTQFNGSIDVQAGELNVMNIAASTSLNVKDVTIAAGATLGVYNGATATADTEHEGTLTMKAGNTLKAGGDNATLNANLVMESGSTLEVSLAQATYGLTMGCSMSLNTGDLLGDADLGFVQDLKFGDYYYLYNGVDSLTVNGTQYDSLNFKDWTDFDMDASTVYTQLDEKRYALVYSWNGSNVGTIAITLIPEPTTGTLSLLALCALAARRRRK